MLHVFFAPPTPLVQMMRSYFRRADPFFDEQENHSLIGVANVFLSCLFYDVKLQYAVPIINQKGEVGGHVLFFLFLFFVLSVQTGCSGKVFGIVSVLVHFLLSSCLN